ncbi:MAG: cellulase family glycosylhydrolase, partial [Oscillospiraceae bacterium]|nr:cellulase family glycosylhydrolase [Oscillospiraceae bacterium]
MTGCNARNEGSIADSAVDSVTETQETSTQSDVSTTEGIEEGVGTDMTHGNAAEIAADIKIGWNLGNTLDCYDVTWAVKDHETAWGNPKTTKEMIDTVKAAGFNAVRIPVSWTDHITEDGTIDAAWMDRVQEVVDYSMDN